MNRKEEVVSVARGYYALPIIVSFARRGGIDKLLRGPAHIEEFDGNPKFVGMVLGYFANLGWVKAGSGGYALTEVGRSVLQRWGAYEILYSYRQYFAELGRLFSEGLEGAAVMREENIRGSGEAHSRKFFPCAEKILAETSAQTIVDIGCGDGSFLRYVHSVNPKLKLVGIDPSPQAQAVAKERVGGDAVMLQGRVEEPNELWLQLRCSGIQPEQCLFSAWFVFHEVLGRPRIALTELLSSYRTQASQHGLIVGELFDVTPEVLSSCRHLSALPEFKLFHEMSGQQLLRMEDWQRAISASGFKESFFVGRDSLSFEDREYFGSGVWHLQA